MAISYCECTRLDNNIPAILEVIKHIYDNIMYAELNLKLDYCFNCGYSGEIEGIVKNKKHIWKCPNCGCEEQKKLSVIRRT